MAYWSQAKLRNHPLFSTLSYSSAYSYPLTAREIWFWQISSRFSYSHILRLLSGLPHYRDHYFLPGGKSTVSLRMSRFKNSLPKLQVADFITSGLGRFFTIQAIFLTGALAMNNSPVDDDIDIMIVTLPHTLWLTRFFVSLYLKLIGVRRDPHLPEHSSPRVKDKICDNLWLDSGHLAVFPHNLYQAHEILQAKCLLDKSGIHSAFLHQNRWVRQYLPVAYSQLSNQLRPQTAAGVHVAPIYFRLLNYFFFVLQFLYMLPRKHGEKIGLGYALFHPNL